MKLKNRLHIKISPCQFQPPLSQKKSALISGIVLSTYCQSFQRHYWRFVTALHSLLTAPPELTFESIHGHFGLPLCHTGKPRQIVNLGSILLSEPISVCGPGYPRTNKTKLEKDTHLGGPLGWGNQHMSTDYKNENFFLRK